MFMLNFNIKNISTVEKCTTTVIAFKDYAPIINYYALQCVKNGKKWHSKEILLFIMRLIRLR